MEKENRKIRILLVDDDQMMQIYFRDLFWIHGKSNKYEVQIASNLEDAKKIVEDSKTRPDLIFLDVIITDKKKGRISAYQIARSLEFISNIKKDKDLKKIKIVLYSGHREEDMKEALMKLGIDGYLVKGELMPKEIISFTSKLHG